MDNEQLEKRLEWLEDERRKDKLLVATLQDRIANLEEKTQPIDQRFKELEGEVTRIATSLLRFNQIETAMAQMRQELSRMIQDIEKQRSEKEREIEKIRLADNESVNRSLGEIRKTLEVLPEIRKTLQARAEGENRLGREIEELEQKILLIRRADDEYKRQIKLLEESQRQDAKRLTDLQGEVTALRKRQEEQRGKIDLNADSVRKIETRISELTAAESERRQSQITFMEKQNMLAIERERVWKDWQVRFEQIEAQSSNLDNQLQSLESTQRAVKRAQEAFEEITNRFERRINEITEMQRLVEDRFRQEWVSFKADDQKRWTNYTLAQEEQQRELLRSVGKLEERLMLLEDLIQEFQDFSHQITEETTSRLQSLLALVRNWNEEQEKAISRKR
jgi:chromosome segregation ATPase